VVTVEQKKGLGLGLAIVKRLCALMAVPLDLRSQEGRGSVFTVELPLGKGRARRRDRSRARGRSASPSTAG
jgi:signal transduction histidine kinase